MLPLHHGEADAGANWFQRFNDSLFGVFLGNALHTLGALLFAAGILLFLYLGHLLRRGRLGGAAPHVQLLGYAQGFTLSGIALNGAGGLMRLYESDHPGLDRLGDSTWVQVLVVKHLFLFLGVGLALWLTWSTRRLTDPDYAGVHGARASPKMIAYAIASSVTILLATVLGAVAANVDLDADLGTNPGDALSGGNNPAPEGGETVGPEVLSQSSAPGTITGSAASPGAKDHQFSVPEGADQVIAELQWTSNLAQLSLLLIDPDGDQPSGNTTTGRRTISLVVEGDLEAGDWTVRIRADQAVNEAYTVRLVAARTGGLGNIVDRTVVIEPGQFHEANLLMANGDRIDFEWSLVNSTSKIYFDVHLHPSSTEVTYPVQGDFNRYEGNYTHDGVTQGPSLLWDNTLTEPVRVHYRLWGDFGIHSYFPAG